MLQLCSGSRIWQLGAKEYHKVTPLNKPHMRNLLGGNKLRKVAASAGARSSQELSSPAGLIWDFRGAGFSKVAWELVEGRGFLRRPGIGGILWPNLGASSGVGRILFPESDSVSWPQSWTSFVSSQDQGFFWSFYPTEGMTNPSSWLISGEAEALDSAD